MCMCEEADFNYFCIWIKLNFIIMETILSNLVDLSFEHVLHSHGLHLVSKHKCEIGNYPFDSIFLFIR